MIRALLRPALLALLACSLTVNVGFAIYAYLRDGGFRPWVALVTAGQPVNSDLSNSTPILAGVSAPKVYAIDGDTTVEFAFGVRPTILYVVSPRCIWCARNTPNVAALHRERASAYEFIGLSLDAKDLDTYLRAHPMPFKVYVAKRETIVTYGLGTTPATIVIDGSGRVTKKFNGAWLRSQPAVEAFFGVKLPGLSNSGL